MKRTFFAALIGFVVLPPSIALSAPLERHNNQALESQVRALEATVKKLSALVESQQKQIESLSARLHSEQPGDSSAKPAHSTSSQAPAVTSGTRVLSGGIGSSQFNPDIGLVGDIVGTLSESGEDLEGNDRISAREIELVVGHDVDPYSRFDATFAFSDQEDPHVEEAYASFWGLPFDVKAKLGRMRPRIGVASSQHRDALDSVDEPLIVQRYLGHEGLFRTGLELSTITPSVTDSLTHEFIVGIMEGGVEHEGTLFGETKRYPSYYGRLRNSLDLSDATLLNIGSSFLAGSADDDSGYEARAIGLDLTLTHHLNTYQRIKFQTEAYLQNRSSGYLKDDDHDEQDAHSLVRDENDEIFFDSDNDMAFRSSPWGMYSLLDYRFSKRWGVGARFDYVEPINKDPDLDSYESAYSAYLTFYQSEFARWRFQYQFADVLENDSDNRVFLQATFAIGTHKHQLQ